MCNPTNLTEKPYRGKNCFRGGANYEATGTYYSIFFDRCRRFRPGCWRKGAGLHIDINDRQGIPSCGYERQGCGADFCGHAVSVF